jgi:hypothetical protein
MGWTGFGSGEKSGGDSEKVSDVQVNVKTDGDKVTEVLVSEKGNPHKEHTHYYEKSSGWWGSKDTKRK